jgi:hypothetical protein
MSLSACFSPYHKDTRSISTIGVSMIPAALAWGFKFAAMWTWVTIPFSS